MGCLHTKSSFLSFKRKTPVEVPNEEFEGSSFSFGSIPKEQFDLLPLTNKQIYSLKASWKGIKRKMDETGVEMFVRLFKTSSELKSMFQNFKHIQTDDQLRSNEALEAHATLVMSTLDDAITHIDNFEFVSSLLTKTGASHIKFANFKSSNFQAIKEPFLEAVRVTLGDRYTENMQSIYAIAIVFILDTLTNGMEEALAAQKGGQQGGKHGGQQESQASTDT